MSSEAQNPKPEPWENAAVLLGMVCLVVWALLSFVGCSPRIVEHIVYQRDTTYVEKVRVDSVWRRDSVFVKEKGDTIYIYKERTRYEYKFLRDTITRVKVDSVTVERIKEVEVVQPLPAWRKWQIRAFWYLVAAVLLLGLWTFRKPILKLLKI